MGSCTSCGSFIGKAPVKAQESMRSHNLFHSPKNQLPATIPKLYDATGLEIRPPNARLAVQNAPTYREIL